MLEITRNECSRILQRSKIRELETHLQMLEERLEEVHELKRKIQIKIHLTNQRRVI